LPDGYVDLGAAVPLGIGRSTLVTLSSLANRSEELKTLRQLSERIAAIIGAIEATSDAQHRASLIARYYKMLALDLLVHRRILEERGLLVPAAA
jgi:hypothetical protein